MIIQQLTKNLKMEAVKRSVAWLSQPMKQGGEEDMGHGQRVEALLCTLVNEIKALWKWVARMEGMKVGVHDDALMIAAGDLTVMQNGEVISESMDECV